MTTMEQSSLGSRLKNARKALGLTAEETADRCFINPIYLRQLESNRGMPSLPLFVALCNTLKVSPAYLLQDQLETADSDAPEEFLELLRRASPSQQQLVLAMLKAALENLPDA